MTQRVRLTAVLALSAVLLIAVPAFAYIDPGTTNAVFTSLTPILAAIGSVIVVALYPFRLLYRWARSLPWYGQVGIYLGALCALAGVCAGVLFLLFLA